MADPAILTAKIDTTRGIEQIALALIKRTERVYIGGESGGVRYDGSFLVTSIAWQDKEKTLMSIGLESVSPCFGNDISGRKATINTFNPASNTGIFRWET